MSHSLRRNKDYSALALERQLRALNADKFEFGIFDEETRHMQLRTWTKEQALGSIAWLKYMNAQRNHIYVRPLGSTGVVLADDINVTTLQKMEADDLMVVCSVLTSELNYQAWIRVSSEPIESGLATAVGEVIARRYDADPGSKDWRHFGRAVGFVNVKPKHVQEDGRYPFVKLYETNLETAKINDELLGAAHQLMKEKAEEEAGLRDQLQRRAAANKKVKPGIPAAVFFDKAVAEICRRYGSGADLSRADWAAAKHMLWSGYTFDDIALAMLSNKSIQERKKGHVSHYVQKMTINKLMAHTQ